MRPRRLPYLAAGAALLLAPWWAAPILGDGFAGSRVAMVRSAVRSGDAKRWHRDFASRRRAILATLWAVAMICLTVLIGRVVNR